MDLAFEDEDDEGGLEMGDQPSSTSATTGPRRRATGGGATGGDAAAPPSKKSVLVLASKHRIVERVGPGELTLPTPERRALDHIDGAEEEAASPFQPASAKTAGDKRATLAALRQLVRDSAEATTSLVQPSARGVDRLEPAVIVAVPDDSAPDLVVLIALDVPDRPGLMRDISDTLLRELTLQVRYSEAAVKGSRSLSIWRCEVSKRGRLCET